MQKTFNKDFKTVYNKCLNTLEELNISVDYKNPTKGLIKGSTGSSLLSWGEEIKITLKELGGNKTNVTIESIASAQLFSWGKNDENEGIFLSKLSDKLK